MEESSNYKVMVGQVIVLMICSCRWAGLCIHDIEIVVVRAIKDSAGT